MLDQNTDRMWYVIGAVLIGAAIIFGMNTLMPEAFANVSDNFNLITSTIGKNINMYGKRKELIKVYTLSDMRNATANQKVEKLTDNSVILSPDDRQYGGFYFTSDVYEAGKSYVLTFDFQKLEGEVHGLGGHVSVASHSTVYMNGARVDMWDRNGLGLWSTGDEIPNEWAATRKYPNDSKKRHIEVYFTIFDDYESIDDGRIYIQPNRVGTAHKHSLNGFDYKVLIENVMLYELVEDVGEK